MTQSIVRLNMLLSSIWNAFDPEDACDPDATRNACIVRLCMSTLQQPENIIDMRMSNVDFVNEVWQVREADGSGVHMLPLTPLTSSLIRSALALDADPDNIHVFQVRRRTTFQLSLQRAFRDRMQSLGCGSVRLNDLRHAGRMRLISSPLSVPVPSVCRILGRYSRLRPQEIRHFPTYESLEMDDKRRTLNLWEFHLRKIVNGLGPEDFPRSMPRARSRGSSLGIQYQSSNR